MKAESWIPTPRHGAGLEGLLYAAAVFWFAVLGGLAVVAAIVASPWPATEIRLRDLRRGE